jgi:endonuclease/exonuclease/phosphatase (EEP) superfamily protein YafD
MASLQVLPVYANQITYKVAMAQATLPRAQCQKREWNLLRSVLMRTTWRKTAIVTGCESPCILEAL